MTVNRLIKIYSLLDEYYSQQHPIEDPILRKAARLSKISEELGELNNAFLASVGWQREEKLDEYHPEELAKEWADVVNTLFSFASSSGIDPEKELISRLRQIFERAKLELPEELKKA